MIHVGNCDGILTFGNGAVGVEKLDVDEVFAQFAHHHFGIVGLEALLAVRYLCGGMAVYSYLHKVVATILCEGGIDLFF